MERLVTIFLMMFSFSTLACPNLEGFYAECINPQFPETPELTKLILKQKVVAGVTHYKLSFYPFESVDRRIINYVADGKTNGSGIPGWTRNISCIDQTLRIHNKVLTDGGESYNYNVDHFMEGDTLHVKLDQQHLICR